MDIQEFFAQSCGRWFSQRTSHHLAFKQTESGQSQLTIELVELTDPAVVALCQQYEVDPNLASCAARVSWNGTMAWDEEKHEGSTVLVTVPDCPGGASGKLLREVGYAEKTPVAGKYVMGADDSLTLITEYETMYSEERLWFASPNLRLRTSTLKRFGGFSMATFCSEIRLGVTKSPEPVATAAARQ